MHCNLKSVRLRASCSGLFNYEAHNAPGYEFNNSASLGYMSVYIQSRLHVFDLMTLNMYRMLRFAQG